LLEFKEAYEEEVEEEEEEEEEEYNIEEGKEEIFSPAKRRKTPPSTPSTSSTPMPSLIKRKSVSIMKPTSEQSMSMRDLNESTARMGLNNGVMNVGQLSVPILRGAWQKKLCKEDEDGDFVTTFKDFNLIRILPHSSVALK
jgi:hypothetical protein